MGRSTSLTDIKKGKILALRAHNVFANKIAMEIHCSRNVVQNFLRQLELYGKNKSTGRPSVLTSRDRRHVLRTAPFKNHDLESHSFFRNYQTSQDEKNSNVARSPKNCQTSVGKRDNVLVTRMAQGHLQ